MDSYRATQRRHRSRTRSKERKPRSRHASRSKKVDTATEKSYPMVEYPFVQSSDYVPFPEPMILMGQGFNQYDFLSGRDSYSPAFLATSGDYHKHEAHSVRRKETHSHTHGRKPDKSVSKLKRQCSDDLTAQHSWLHDAQGSSVHFLDDRYRERQSPSRSTDKRSSSSTKLKKHHVSHEHLLRTSNRFQDANNGKLYRTSPAPDYANLDGDLNADDNDWIALRYPLLSKPSVSLFGDEDAFDPPMGEQAFEPLMKSYKISVTNGTGRLMKQSTFQYSRCTGAKRALIIGINYASSVSSRPLKGCINDALGFRDFLCQYYGFSRRNTRLLTDEHESSSRIPTRENILSGMRWLVRDAKKDDSLVFFYSGHGIRVPDEDGDEEDGYDEAILPIDHNDKGCILDDDMFKIMAENLPTGCRLTAVFDMCYSGSALDLPFSYTSEGKVRGNTVIRARIEQNIISDQLRRLAHRFRYMNLVDQDNELTRVVEGFKALRAKMRVSKGDVVSWSSCEDSQTSMDVMLSGKYTGLLAHAFMESLKQKPNQSYHQLLNNIRNFVARNSSHRQTAQLSSSHPIDTRIKFKM